MTAEQEVYDGSFFCPVQNGKPEFEWKFQTRQECRKFVTQYRKKSSVGFITFTAEVPPFRGRKAKW